MNDELERDHGAAPRDLLRPEVLAAFDRESFERQGYWVWDGVLTDEGLRRWTATLQRLQAMNDAVLTGTDWGAIDYAARGLPAPDPEVHTPEFLATCRGGSEQMRVIQTTPGLRDYMKDHGLFGPGTVPAADGAGWEGVMPEYFSPAYDDFILDVTTTHPQMMELFGKLLGPRFLLDHILMLNRPPGSTGRRWHAHGYRQGQHETEDVYGGVTTAAPRIPSTSRSSACAPCAIPRAWAPTTEAASWPWSPAPTSTAAPTCGTPGAASTTRSSRPAGCAAGSTPSPGSPCASSPSP